MSGRPQAGARRAREARRVPWVEAVYIGTESPEINVERVEHRVASRTGHRADVEKLPEDHAVSLSDLRELSMISRPSNWAVVRGVARPLMNVYRYRVGAGSGRGCATRSAFTNAPQGFRPFRVLQVP